MKKSVTILDLFAGYGGAELSFKYAGIDVKKSYISEINPSALRVLEHHYPNAIFVGDVRNLNPMQFLDIDFICAGSPCQDLSICGFKEGMITDKNKEIYSTKEYIELKNKGFKFEGQSYLFFEVSRLYHGIRNLQKKFGLPQAKILFENVVMDKKWEDVITKELKLKPILFDAALVSAQSRERLFWSELTQSFKLPEDQNIKLGDVIKGAVNGCGYRGRKNKDGVYYYPQTIRTDNKANCLITRLGSVVEKTGEKYGTGFYVNKKGESKLLTIEQAEILQGLEKGYTKVKDVSNTARVKMIGNGWSIPVTGTIIKQNKKEILKSK